jgi:hypothetical protein
MGLTPKVNPFTSGSTAEAAQSENGNENNPASGGVVH